MPVPPPQREEALRELLERVSEALDLGAGIDIVEDDGTFTATLDGHDLGLFIGRHGQTIDAVQHLAQRIVLGGGPGTGRVIVDAEGYRRRREEALYRQADQAADEAVQYARPVALDAMTAGERRIVHEYLRDRGGVDTHSEGDEPDRHLVVSPTVAD